MGYGDRDPDWAAWAAERRRYSGDGGFYCKSFVVLLLLLGAVLVIALWLAPQATLVAAATATSSQQFCQVLSLDITNGCVNVQLTHLTGTETTGRLACVPVVDPTLYIIGQEVACYVDSTAVQRLTLAQAPAAVGPSLQLAGAVVVLLFLMACLAWYAAVGIIKPMGGGGGGGGRGLEETGDEEDGNLRAALDELSDRLNHETESRMRLAQEVPSRSEVGALHAEMAEASAENRAEMQRLTELMLTISKTGADDADDADDRGGGGGKHGKHYRDEHDDRDDRGKKGGKSGGGGGGGGDVYEYAYGRGNEGRENRDRGGGAGRGHKPASWDSDDMIRQSLHRPAPPAGLDKRSSFANREREREGPKYDSRKSFKNRKGDAEEGGGGRHRGGASESELSPRPPEPGGGRGGPALGRQRSRYDAESDF